MTITSAMQIGVHRSHCCYIHGCKYGEDDCPVVKGVIIQKYTCEQCNEENITIDQVIETNI